MGYESLEVFFMGILRHENHNGHDSRAQMSIWHSIMMLAPFRAAGINSSAFNDEHIIEGEKQFYDFMKDLYNDMYKSPTKYAVPTSEYDEYIKNRHAENDPVHPHKTDAKESKLRNTFHQAIEFYPNYFYEIGRASNEFCKETFAIILTKQQYEDVIRKLKRSHIRKGNEQRLKVLEGLGVTVSEINNAYHISCKNAPKMFLGVHVLCSALESKYKYMNFLRLDYSSYHRSVPDIESIKPTLKEEHANKIDQAIKSIVTSKMKYKVKPMRGINFDHGWKVEYTLNGKNVLGFFATPDSLAMFIYFNDEKNISKMSNNIKDNNPLFDWFCDKFPERLCKCPHARYVFLGDEKRRICGMSNKAEVYDPTVDDLENIIVITKMFRDLP